MQKLLWIAFKNYYLRDTTQHLVSIPFWAGRCELLSKIIIFVTRHNLFQISHIIWSVVNCFQKLLSSWHDTTHTILPPYGCGLWIAFKNYYLRDTTQQGIADRSADARCELLSKIIIFVTRHNDKHNNIETVTVVNCFQKLLSSWHDTTLCQYYVSIMVLWIAFKNYYLRDTTQRNCSRELVRFRCELLSKIIIFVTRHNENVSKY